MTFLIAMYVVLAGLVEFRHPEGRHVNAGFNFIFSMMFGGISIPVGILSKLAGGV